MKRIIMTVIVLLLLITISGCSFYEDSELAYLRLRVELLEAKMEILESKSDLGHLFTANSPEVIVRPTPTVRITPTPTPTPTPKPTPISVINPDVAYVEYTIQAGDTMSKISALFYDGDSNHVAEIVAFNENLTDPCLIRVGQVIKIPTLYSNSN